jgi:HEAT repeat protein
MLAICHRGSVLMPDVLEHLITQLQSSNSKIRQQAAEQLGALRDTCAVELLIARLRDRVDQVQVAAALALGQIGDANTVAPLIQSLHGETYGLTDGDGSPEQYFMIVASAAQALGTIGTPPAITALLAQLVANAPLNTEGTAAAALGLGHVHDPRSVLALLQALQNRSYFVRDHAAGALGQVGDSQAVEPLIETLRDRVWTVQIAAAEALGNLRDVRAAEPLRAIVQNVARFAAGPREHHFHLRAKAARGIALIGDPPSLQLLERGVCSQQWARRVTAAVGLAYRMDSRSLDILVSALTTPLQALQIEVVEALGALGDRRAIPALQAVADSQRIPTRVIRVARHALKQFGAVPLGELES